MLCFELEAREAMAAMVKGGISVHWPSTYKSIAPFGASRPTAKEMPWMLAKYGKREITRGQVGMATNVMSAAKTQVMLAPALWERVMQQVKALRQRQRICPR